MPKLMSETPFGPRGAVADWLRANGIDPNDVPQEGPITVEAETKGGHLRIRYAALLRNEAGHCYVDPATGEAARVERTALLTAQPPANVQVSGALESP